LGSSSVVIGADGSGECDLPTSANASGICYKRRIQSSVLLAGGHDSPKPCILLNIYTWGSLALSSRVGSDVLDSEAKVIV